MSVVGLSAATLAALSRASEPERAAALAVYTGDRLPGPETPAVLGRVTADEAGLSFHPRFPFVPGLAYTARVQVGEVRVVRTFEVAAAVGMEPPRVVAVHPSGDTLPANTLRLYVHFSRPMEASGVHRHLRLIGPDGAEVPLAFVEMQDGLWDPGQTRLTLLFHPGRVKRAVAPGERLGPPLRAGGAYRLVIGAGLADTAGVALGRDFERRFRAVAADRVSPRASDLRVLSPRAAADPAVVILPEPLDEALLRRWLWVEDAEGRPVSGRVEVGEGETRWTFVPDAAWGPGPYAVRVRPGVEDRAGNRFDRLFDRARGTRAPSAEEVIRLPFVVGKPE